MYQKGNVNETSDDVHTYSDPSGAHICGLSSLRSTEGICLHVCTMQIYNIGPGSLGGCEELSSHAFLHPPAAINSCACLLPHCIRLILDDTLSGVFRTCLNPAVRRGEIQLEGLTFLSIIGEFGLQGTTGGASPT